VSSLTGKRLLYKGRSSGSCSCGYEQSSHIQQPPSASRSFFRYCIGLYRPEAVMCAFEVRKKNVMSNQVDTQNSKSMLG